MKRPWSLINFIDSIRKTAVGRENQILAAEIQAAGQFPVVDQGKAFIAGYSDAEERVIRDGLPVVIFGDHTRCLKYVDFPFILGADGTKVLKPKEDLFDTKFFYYALLSLDIRNRGYNRHFTLLKEKKVPQPEKDEQKKIADVLGVLERAIELQERIIQMTTELKKTLMQKLFTEGLRGEPQKQTEIGPVPESWEVIPLGLLATIEIAANLLIDLEIIRDSMGGQPHLCKPEMLVIAMGEYGIHPTLNEEGVAISKIFPAGTILITIAANIGFTGILDFDSACPDSLIGLTPTSQTFG